MTCKDIIEERADLATDEAQTREALAMLATNGNDVYEAAQLAIPREGTRTWWSEIVRTGGVGRE